MATPPNATTVFQYLNQTRHRIKEDQHPSLFDQTNPEQNNAEYWLLSDLYNLYRNTFAINPYRPIDPQLIEIITHDHTPITYSNHAITFNTKNAAIKSDAKLSRYACWRIISAALLDPFSQAYFISPDKSLDELKLISNIIHQIHLRKDIARLEHTIGGILHRRGIKFSLFYRALHMTFYNDYNSTELKIMHNIPDKPNDPITNYMGPRSLWARQYGLEKTIYLADKTQNPILLSAQTAFQMARYKMIETYQITPEQDISPTPIKQVQSQYNKMERDFIRQYKNQSIR